jgi:hypothetical protein
MRDNGFVQITYRRSGGIFALIVFAVVAIAATVFAAAAALTALAVLVVAGAVALVARALLPRSWRRRAAAAPPQVQPWSGDTIDATVVRDVQDVKNLQPPS